MNCKRARSISLDFFDGDLPNHLKKDLEEHLEVCESCKEAFNRISVLLSENSQLQRFQVSPQFQQALWNRIKTPVRVKGHSAFHFPRILIPRLSYGFATLLLTAIITFTALNLHKESDEMGNSNWGVEDLDPELISGQTQTPAFPEEIYVLDPIVPVPIQKEELYMLDHTSYGEDSLIHFLPVYSGNLRLVSY
jgi:hypothetical protein